MVMITKRVTLIINLNGDMIISAQTCHGLYLLRAASGFKFMIQ